MKTKKEILEYYGKCCVSEYCLCENRDYPAGKQGEALKRRDDAKNEDIWGQKKLLNLFLNK